ncbi:MAG: class I SAM-dependent methyltransferase [Gammaproteobacteria bacterium]
MVTQARKEGPATRRPVSLRRVRAQPRLPYFDTVFRLLDSEPGAPLLQALGARHVHWGYYPDAGTGDTSLAALQRAQEALTEQLVAAADVRDGQRVLDAGCGFGGTAAFLTAHYSGLEVSALNIDARQLRRARSLASGPVPHPIIFVQADACALPYADGVFDTLLAVECIFHFPSRLRFFREARRVLRPGGWLAISDFVPHGPAIPRLAAWVLAHAAEIERFYGWFNYLSPCSVTGYRWMAKRRGFAMREDRDITAHTLPTYPALLGPIRATGHRAAERATELAQEVSRRGWVRYRILSFEAIV